MQAVKGLLVINITDKNLTGGGVELQNKILTLSINVAALCAVSTTSLYANPYSPLAPGGGARSSGPALQRRGV